MGGAGTQDQPARLTRFASFEPPQAPDIANYAQAPVSEPVSARVEPVSPGAPRRSKFEGQRRAPEIGSRRRTIAGAVGKRRDRPTVSA
jgi:hypothetical protein